MKIEPIKLTTGLSIAIIIAITSIASAQHNHGGHHHGGNHHTQVHHPPHGGQMKESGRYHIEMVADLMLKEDQLSFYLFKGNLKPVIDDGVLGTITIEYKDSPTIKDTLQVKGNDRFVAQLATSQPFQCTVEFLIKGKIVSTVFNHQGLGYNLTTVYSCPMHPDIQENSPGTCSKCGMNLKKQ